MGHSRCKARGKAARIAVETWMKARDRRTAVFGYTAMINVSAREQGRRPLQ